MKKLLSSCTILLLAYNISISQSVGVGTTAPDGSAQLDISSTTKGVLIPRMTLLQRTAIISPATGLLVYQSDVADSSFYWYNGLSWTKLFSEKSGWGLAGNTGTNAATNFIGTTDNKNLQFRVNNIKAGTIDNQNKNVIFGTRAAVNIGVNARENTFLGDSVFGTSALSSIGNVAVGYATLSQPTTTLNYATVVGWNAGRNNQGSWATIIGAEAGMSNAANGNVIVGSSAGKFNQTGFQNTFVGDNAGRENVSAYDNAFFGSYAGATNTGFQNTFIGALSGVNNTYGSSNSFIGEQSGLRNTSGDFNVFVGQLSGHENTIGVANIFLGHNAGYSNIAGSRSVAIGRMAGFSMNQPGNVLMVAIGDSAGYYNTAVENMFIGASAGLNNATGNKNTFIGTRSGYTNTTGNSNTAIGNGALAANNASLNTAIGDHALHANISGNFNTAVGTGSLQSTMYQAGNTAVGFEALSANTGGYNTAVGSGALRNNTGQSNNIAIGTNADVANGGIFNATVIGTNIQVGASNMMMFGNFNTNAWGFARPTVSAGAALQVGQPTFGNGNGAYASTGGTWFNASDENLKENILSVDKKDMLSRIMQLNITQWDYKGGTVRETHIGPMAQQFKQLFSLGIENNDVSISTVDPAGIALIGVQALEQQNRELTARLTEQQQLIDTLVKRMKTLEEQQLKRSEPKR